MEGVANIVRVFGRYDLVLMIRALDIDAAGKLVGKIREIDGVSYTETLIAAPPPEQPEDPCDGIRSRQIIKTLSAISERRSPR